jgi:N-acetylneuraminic acid mutarotase
MKKTRLFISIVLFPLVGLSQQNWKQISDLPDTVRHHAIGFSLGDRGYIIGGMVNAAPPDYLVQNDFMEYNPYTNVWGKKFDFPRPITEAVSFVIDDIVYVLTGRDSTEEIKITEIYSWDGTSSTWTVVGSVPAEIIRIRGVGFSIGNKGYIATGLDANQTVFLNDLWEYDPTLNSWTQKADFPGVGRYDAVCFVLDNRAYITTGNSLQTPVNDLWEYNPNTDTWTQKASFIGPDLEGALGLSINNLGYIITGRSLTPPFQFNNGVWQYNPINDSWIEFDLFPGELRTYSSGFVLNDKGYIISGWFFGLPYLTNWEFTPSSTSTDKHNKQHVFLYPNPSTGVITVKFEQDYFGPLQVELTDLGGRACLSSLSQKNEKAFELNWDISIVKRGIYLLKITNNSGLIIFSQKIIKI